MSFTVQAAIGGCTDPTACNYNADATVDDGSCEHPVWMIPEMLGSSPAILDCESNLPAGYGVGHYDCIQSVVDADPYCVTTAWDGICQTAYEGCIAGCHDPMACNYLNQEINSCVYPGCTDDSACNFNPFAGCDDESCQFTEPIVDLTTHPWLVYTTPDDQCSDWASFTEIQLDPDGTAWYVFNNPQHPLFGQPQPYGIWNMCADQFFLYGTAEPFSVEWNGGIYHFNPQNNTWVGTYSVGPTESQSGVWGEGDVAHIAGTANNTEYNESWCFEFLWIIQGCTAPSACNFNPLAVIDDESCLYPGCTDDSACNFNPFAGCDDESCQFTEPIVDLTTHPWLVYTTPDDQCSDWASFTEIQLDPDGTAWYVFNNPQHPLFGQPQPYGIWNMCADQFFLYGTAEPFSVEWNGGIYHFNPQNNTWVGTYSVGPTESQSGVWGEGDVAHIAGTANNTEYNESWCFEFLWIIQGCTAPSACNFNPLAVIDDESCLYPGCTDDSACNFNPFAGCDDGSCQFTEPIVDLTTHPWTMFDANMVNSACDTFAAGWDYVLNPDGTIWLTIFYDAHPMYGQFLEYGIWGMCGDSFFMMGTQESITVTGISGYQSSFTTIGVSWTGTFNHGSSNVWPHGPAAVISGTASDAFGETWCFEMLWQVEGCMDPTAYNYEVFSIIDSDCCVHELTNVLGCTSAEAVNFQPIATHDDGSCVFMNNAGCTYPSAPNYDPNANFDDGSCDFGSSPNLCPADVNLDGTVAISDLLIVLSTFGETCD